jgi:hypothetical protein
MQSGTPQSVAPAFAQPIQPGIPNYDQPQLYEAPYDPLQSRGNPYSQPIRPGTVYDAATGQPEISQLIKKLRDADDDAKKEEITRQIEAVLTKSFDRDLDVRQNDLEKLDERVSKLRALLDRRRKAKADIIQLQVKVLVNEAEGLGFGGHAVQPGYTPSVMGITPPSATPIAGPSRSINQELPAMPVPARSQ